MFGKNSPERKAMEEKRDLLNQIASLKHEISTTKTENEKLKNHLYNINQEHEKKILEMKN